MIYSLKGTDSETGRPVDVEIGWDPNTGYFLGIDDSNGAEIVGKTGILGLPEIVNETRGYLTWDRRTYQGVRDLAVLDYISKDPESDPVARLLAAAR